MKSGIKDKSKEGLIKVVEDGRSSLKSFRFGVSGSRVKNVREARNTRRNVARALTALR
ncbi:MAG: 50S ribosomal protein L29 [Candidatus Vogelbacteria bacterium]|nr:50S ribosomal protein L29 [Candidatus Vogelbacteria bacterium]